MGTGSPEPSKGHLYRRIILCFNENQVRVVDRAGGDNVKTTEAEREERDDESSFAAVSTALNSKTAVYN